MRFVARFVAVIVGSWAVLCLPWVLLIGDVDDGVALLWGMGAGFVGMSVFGGWVTDA